MYRDDDGADDDDATGLSDSHQMVHCEEEYAGILYTTLERT